uniref:RING-type E3 ubiquitin transferase n=1 Tax=Oryza rufipogon TaxID=4529 RepID=A0A0E0NGQ2_ORYRU
MAKPFPDPPKPPVPEPPKPGSDGACYDCPSPPPPPPPHSRDHRRVVIALATTASLLFAILLAFSVYCFIRRRRQQRARREALLAPPPSDAAGGGGAPGAPVAAGDGAVGGAGEGEGEGEVLHHAWHIRTVGLDEAAIESIALARYRAGAGMLGATDCPVCLGEFRDGELLRLLPKCGHAFHVPCIDAWLRAHVNCPLCRAHVLHPADADADAGDGERVPPRRRRSHRPSLEPHRSNRGPRKPWGSSTSSGYKSIGATSPARRSRRAGVPTRAARRVSGE